MSSVERTHRFLFRSRAKGAYKCDKHNMGGRASCRAESYCNHIHAKEQVARSFDEPSEERINELFAD